MAEALNNFGVKDWVAAPLPDFGVGDWQTPAPPPPAPAEPKPPPLSSTFHGISEAINQFPTEAIGRLTTGVGASIASAGTALPYAGGGIADALAGAPLAGAQNAQSFTRQQTGIINRIDAGETVPAMDDPYGYAQASDAQKTTIRESLQRDLARMPKPEDTALGQISGPLQPIADATRTGLDAAGGAITTAGKAVMSGGDWLIKEGERLFPLTDEEKGRTSVIATKGALGVLEFLGAGLVGGPAAVIGLAGVDGVGTHYQAAEKAGATPEQAATAGFFGGLVDGSLMAVPIGKAIELAGALPSLLIKRQFLTVLWDMAKSGATFTAFGQLQHVADNLVAKNIYKPDQDVSEGVGDKRDMAIQFGLGAALPGIGAAMRGAGRMAVRRMVGNIEGVELRGGAGEPPAPGEPPTPGGPPGPAPVAPDQRLLAAPDIDSAIAAAQDATTRTSPGAPPAASVPKPPVAPDAPFDAPSPPKGESAPPPIRGATPANWGGRVEQGENGDYQFRQTDASGTETVHPIVEWNPDTPAAPGATTISPDTATNIRDHYAAAGVRTVFYQHDPALPFDGTVDAAHPNTLFLSNQPTRNIEQVAGHEFTHVLATTILPDGTNLGELLNQQVAAGITPAGKRYAEKMFGETAPQRGGFPEGAEGTVAHAAAVQAHLINELGTDIGGEAPKFQSFIPRVMDAIQARFGDNVAADMLRKMMDGLRSAMQTIRGLFGETGTRSQNWVTNIGEVHDTLARMYAERFGTPVEREQGRLATMRDQAERDRFVTPETNGEQFPKTGAVSENGATPEQGAGVNPVENPVKLTPAPEPGAAPSTTGLAEIGNMGKAMGENLRASLWAKTQAGETTEAGGMPSNLLILAKSARDAGGLQTEAEFRSFMDALAPHLNDRSEGWQGRLLEAGRPFAAPASTTGRPAVTDANRPLPPPTEAAPPGQVPSPASKQLPPAPAAAHDRILQMRRWLDRLAEDRAAAAAASAKVAVLQQTEAAILRPVAGDQAALTTAGQTRLEDVRTQIDAAKHPTADTPEMATVRTGLAEAAAELAQLRTEQEAIAQRWDQIGNPGMAQAVRAGAAQPWLTRENVDFNRGKLNAAIAKLDPNAPRPAETFSLVDFMQSGGRDDKTALATIESSGSPEARAMVPLVQQAGQLLTDRMNGLGFTTEEAGQNRGGPIGDFRERFSTVLATFTRFARSEIAIRKGYQRASMVARNQDLEALRNALETAGIHPDAIGMLPEAAAVNPVGNPVKPSAPAVATAIKGPYGDFGDYSRFTPGALLTSESGRALTPVPAFRSPDGSNAAFSRARKIIDRWLINEAKTEATANGDAHLADMLARETVDNFPPASRDMAMTVVFGNDRGPEARHAVALAATNPVASPVKPSAAVTGKPATFLVYHGTPKAGAVREGGFDRAYLGSSSDVPSARQGFFFTESPTTAASYARDDLGGEVVAVTVRSTNPKVVDVGGKHLSDTDLEQMIDDEAAVAELDKHDAVVFKGIIDPGNRGMSTPDTIVLALRDAKIELFPDYPPANPVKPSAPAMNAAESWAATKPGDPVGDGGAILVQKDIRTRKEAEAIAERESGKAMQALPFGDESFAVIRGSDAEMAQRVQFAREAGATSFRKGRGDASGASRRLTLAERTAYAEGHAAEAAKAGGTVAPAEADRNAMPPAPTDAALGEQWWKSLTGTGRQIALDAAGLKAGRNTAWQYLSVAQRTRLLAANRALPAKPAAAYSLWAKNVAEALTREGQAGAAEVFDDMVRINDLDAEQRARLLTFTQVAVQDPTWKPTAEAAAGAPPPPPPEASQAKPTAEPEPPRRPEAEAPNFTVPPEPDLPPDFGANNKTFTADMAAKARATLREKFNRLNAGFDPEIMAAGFQLSGFYIEGGVRRFAEYAKRMIADVGIGVKPHLPNLYNSVREFHGFDAKGMDDAATVAAELKRMPEAPTKAVEGADGRRPGEVDQPRGDQAKPGGGRPGELAGDGRAGGVETRPAENVPGAGEPGAAAGLRPGGEVLPVGAAVPAGGNAANGRDGAGNAGVAASGAGGADRPVPASVRPNFHIADPELLIGGTPKVRFARNRVAIESLRNIEEDQRDPTPTELQSLAGYIGWGSFGQDLFQGSFEQQPPRKGWDDEGKWLRDHLGKDAWESAQRSIINAHYTDPPTVQAMWDMVQRMGFKGGRVLEPSMGIGNFFGMMPRDVMAASTLTGIELDRLSAQMAKLLYPVAGIHQKGYQESKTPDGFYDLVIGNWPFAAQSPADRRYDRLSPTLHDYFFLKALDQTRPGGLVVGITSAGTMDKAGRSVRIEMAKKGELLGAFRLPSGAFEKYAGTQVVTDILVFRKRTEPVADVLAEPWIDATDMKVASGETIRVNKYFQDHPDAVLGTFGFGRGLNGRQAMTVARPPDFAEKLAALADRLPKDGFAPVLRGSEPRFVSNNTTDRQNSITIGEDGKLYQVAGERMMLLEDVAKGLRAGTQKQQKAVVNQVENLVSMRRSYGALIDAERDGRPETEDVRQSLAKQYEAFVAKHGPLAASPGLAVLFKAKDPAFSALSALVRPDGTPSQILSEPTIRSRRSIDNPSVADAYVMARNEKAVVNIDRVAELAKLPRETIEHELLTSGAIMRSPGAGFEPKDVYLSGNVRRKLREAQDALANGEDMQASVDALTNVLPPTVPYHQIEAKFGAPWAGDATYKAFIGDVLGLPADRLDDVRIRFAGSRWRVTFANAAMNRTPEAMQAGHVDYRFDKLVQMAMGNTLAVIKRRGDDGEYVDHVATEEVNAKAQALRERFQDWAWADAERKVRLEGTYNDVMNAIAKPHYDGSFMDLSGMALRRGTDPFSLRKHQMDAIWRGVVTGRGLFAHEVGTGKSYTMGGIAMEGRRYGIFRKPLVLAHNANSAAVAQEFQDMYPGGKFLYIDNLAPAVIETTLHRIANEDWDAVIMPHSLIDRMTLTRETLMELATDQITALENEAMEAATEDGVKLTPEMMDDPEAMKKVRSITAKALVKQREALIANIEKQANRASKEGAIAFERLGVDAVIVDEAHEFKKPVLATRMQLKGLNTKASDRSIALNFLTGYVNKQNNGRGTYLFTGTPVTNALNEVFNMARYFMGDRMEADGVKDWDAWFNTFADAISDVELTADGSYEPVKRLSAFVNVDELVRQMSEFTDVVQAKDMPEFVPRQTADGKTLTSPDLTPEGRDFLQNGRAESPVGRPYKKILTNVAEMSADQRMILDELQARWRAFKAAKGRVKQELLKKGEGLKIQNGLRAATLDARMFDPDAADDPASKVNRVAAKVIEHYAEDRAAQAIFVDQGYNANKTSEGRAERFVLIKDLVAKLVEAGIPRKEIKIVAGGVEAAKKKEIADAMNAGTVRVVIGQSGTLGVGVNMQTNLRAMHHMDAPWRPGDLEQRNGRGERQGNEWNTVLEHRYVTEGIDGRGWQILTTKDRFIKQFINAFNDTSGKRLGNIEGDAADIGESEDILTTLGQAAGDPRIMLRAKFAADVTRLERRERMHTHGQVDAAQMAREMRQQLASQKISDARDAARLQTWEAGAARAEEAKAVATAALDAQHAEAKAADPASALTTDLDAQRKASRDRRFYDATVGGKVLHTQAEIQPALDSQVEKLKPGDDKVLATINGHDLQVRYPVGRDATFTFAGSHMEAATVPRITGAITALRNRVAFATKPGNFEESVLRLEAAADEPFPRQADLLKKRQQLTNLVDDLQANPVPAPAWLRHGAPLDSDIYVDGEKRVVRGHRMSDDYKLVTDEGEVSYRRARDENGNQIYEVHAPPPQPEADANGSRDTVAAVDTLGDAPDGAQFSPKITGTQRESEPYTPDQMKAYANVGRITDAPTWRERLESARKDVGRRIIAAVLDPYIGVKADDPAGYMALRNANTTSGALIQFMTDGTLKFDGSAYAMADRNGGVEHHLIRPLKGEENRFIWWVAANRAERLSTEDRENLWSADDIATLKATNQGTVPFDYTLSSGTVTRSREAIYLDSLKKLDVFNRNTMDLAVQSGLIGSEAANVFLANPFYVPFYRQPEGGEDGKGRFSGTSIQAGFVKQHAFKTLKGGAEKLNHDLWANAIGNWSHMIDASLRNRAAAGVLDTAVTNGAAIEVSKEDVGYMSKRDREGLVWVMNDGQRQSFQVTDPMLFTAISALDFSGYRNPIMNAMTKFKTVLTMGVTSDPRFMLRVFIKDAEQAVAVAPMSANLVGNVIQGLKMSNSSAAIANIARTIAGREAQRVPISDEAANAIAGGATMHLGSGHDTGQRKISVDTMLDSAAATSGFLTRLGKIARATKELSAVAEDVQRLAIYHKLIAEGVPHDQAAFAGRDMEDFTLRGGWAAVRFFTQTVPFLNAMMQGLYKVARSAASADRNITVAVGKRIGYAASRRLAAVLAASALLTLALDALYADDEDYKKRTDDDRNSNFWFKIGGTQFRIPMGFEIAAVSRIAVNGLEAFVGANEMTGRRFFNTTRTIIADNLMMNPTPQAVKPLLEVAMNRSSQGAPIVPQRLDKLQSQEQFTPASTLMARGASALGSSAARTIAGPQGQFLAPTQIDYLVNAYFGWLGAMTMTVADNAVRGADQAQAALRGVRPNEPVRADKDLWAYVSGGMVASETTPASRYVNMLYEQKAGVDAAFATYHDMLARQENVQARAFFAENKALISRHEGLASLGRSEAEFNKQIRRIEVSPTLSAEQKHDQVMRYEAMKNKAAENIFGSRRATP